MVKTKNKTKNIKSPNPYGKHVVRQTRNHHALCFLLKGLLTQVFGQ
jgi:hypothetical protein